MGSSRGGGKALGWAGRKLLGPLFDEVGKGLAETYSDYRSRNLEAMIENASVKGRAALETGHAASPRVAYRIVEAGS